MANWMKRIFRKNFALQNLDLGTFEFDNFPAANAHQMIVMAPCAGPFKKLPLAFSRGLLNHSAFQKQRKRPVNRIPSDPEPLISEPLVETVRVKVSAQSHHFPVNCFPVKCVLEPAFLKQVFEFFFFF